MEGAIKVARKYHAETGHPEQFHLIACTGSFHGRTLATLAAAGNEKYLHGFGPPAPGFDHVPYGDLALMRAAIGPETAAILVEPVQGEGGLATATPEYLRGLRALCDEHGILLVFDEVQSGMGRTGKLFAHQWAGHRARRDGARQGARRRLPGRRGPRHRARGPRHDGGNPWLDLRRQSPRHGRGQCRARRDARAPHSSTMSSAWRRCCASVSPASSPSTAEVFAEQRGKGLLAGLKCLVPNTEMVEKLRNAGLITVAAGDNVVRLLPPLIIEDAQVAEAAQIIDRVAGQWKL